MRTLPFLHLGLFLAYLICGSVHASAEENEDMDEYVRQVLEDDEAHNENPYDNAYSTDEQYEKHQEELKRRQQAEQSKQEKLEMETNQRRAQEREDAFERKMQKLSEEEQKKARQKKRCDTKLVNRLLRAAERHDFYAVLGLQHRFRASRTVPAWIGKFMPWCQITSADIKKAYRAMGKLVHPDKNHDGRADMAFVALDEAFNLLYDEKARESYNQAWSDQSSDQWKMRHGKVHKVLHSTQKVVTKTAGTVRKIVGPFSVPLGILAVVFV